jgi:hypothetical protein
MREGGQVNSNDSPSPRSCLAGRGRKNIRFDVTQGGARSEPDGPLACLGYYQVIPCGISDPGRAGKSLKRFRNRFRRV